MCPQYTIHPVQGRGQKALCNRSLKSIVQCTQNKQGTKNSEFSSLAHLILRNTWNLNVKCPSLDVVFVRFVKLQN